MEESKVKVFSTVALASVLAIGMSLPAHAGDREDRAEDRAERNRITQNAHVSGRNNTVNQNVYITNNYKKGRRYNKNRNWKKHKRFKKRFKRHFKHYNKRHKRGHRGYRPHHRSGWGHHKYGSRFNISINIRK